jgi:hypothetical protein
MRTVGPRRRERTAEGGYCIAARVVRERARIQVVVEDLSPHDVNRCSILSKEDNVPSIQTLRECRSALEKQFLQSVAFVAACLSRIHLSGLQHLSPAQ